ncbi:hypothetical protein [Nocardia alni]|uniref:hypothetical protein n=1 Tax=Nocardia alni TaxID=2815723 RepID=UPI0020B42F81|nr:hypothetical protein [Nocardia alni]
MSPTVCTTQDISQFREVASRLASVIQSSPDRINSLNKFVEAVSDPDTFTDMILRYAGRWLTETSGQSVLIGPEMFWQLSSPERRSGSLIADSSPCVDNGCGERTRKMLLVCVLESLAQSQWHSVAATEHRAAANNLTDSRLSGSIGEHTLVNSAVIDRRFVTNGG